MGDVEVEAMYSFERVFYKGTALFSFIRLFSHSVTLIELHVLQIVLVITSCQHSEWRGRQEHCANIVPHE